MPAKKPTKKKIKNPVTGSVYVYRKYSKLNGRWVSRIKKQKRSERSGGK